MHQSRTLSIGVDVPKASMAMVYGAKGDHAEVTALGTIGTRPGALALRILKRVVGYFASLAHTAEGLIDQNSPLLNSWPLAAASSGTRDASRIGSPGPSKTIFRRVCKGSRTKPPLSSATFSPNGRR